MLPCSSLKASDLSYQIQILWKPSSEMHRLWEGNLFCILFPARCSSSVQFPKMPLHAVYAWCCFQRAHLNCKLTVKSWDAGSWSSTFPTFFFNGTQKQQQRKKSSSAWGRWGWGGSGAEGGEDEGNAALFSLVWSKFSIFHQWPCVSLPLPAFLLHTAIFQSAAVGNSSCVYPFCGPHPFHFNSKVGCIGSLWKIKYFRSCKKRENLPRRFCDWSEWGLKENKWK